jgi:hypothetical protein
MPLRKKILPELYILSVWLQDFLTMGRKKKKNVCYSRALVYVQDHSKITQTQLVHNTDNMHRSYLGPLSLQNSLTILILGHLYDILVWEIAKIEEE